MKYLVLLFFVTSILFSCDQIDDPIPVNSGAGVGGEDTLAVGDTFPNGQLIGAGDTLSKITEYIPEQSLNINSQTELREYIFTNIWDTASGFDNSNKRAVILEDFTGHMCANCPRGSIEIDRLNTKYGDQFIPIGIHTGTFAEPEKFPSRMYLTDFRLPGDVEGQVYYKAFRASGQPSGIINRLGSAGLETTWEPDIQAVVNLLPQAELKLVNYYNSTANVIRSQIDIIWKETLPEQYNLQLFVVESNIVDWQLDGSNDDPDYIHKHVLRKVVNGTFGKATKTATIGTRESIQYLFEIDDTWVAENVEIVAFLFDSDANSYEVIQANSAHIEK